MAANTKLPGSDAALRRRQKLTIPGADSAGSTFTGGGSVRAPGAEIGPVPGAAAVQSTAPRAAAVQSAAPAAAPQDYAPSAAVTDAEAAYRAAAQGGPGAYQSPYAAQLDELYGRLAGREAFSYDPDSDALYRRYAEQYRRLGRRAMEDTQGRAAALTGGYASSYAQRVGQETYDEYLEQLNDKVPELYKLAWDRYRAEGDDLARLYSLMGDREAGAYDRWRDAVADQRNRERDAWDRYADQYRWDYDRWSDDRDYAADRADREADLAWRQQQFDYQRQRDAVSDEHWERSYAASQARAASRGGSRSSGGSRSGSRGGGDGAAAPASGGETLVHVPGYGYVSPGDAQAMVAAGTLEWVRGDGRSILTDEDGRPVARMRRAPVSGPFRMVQ